MEARAVKRSRQVNRPIQDIIADLTGLVKSLELTLKIPEAELIKKAQEFIGGNLRYAEFNIISADRRVWRW